jgi:16S rRNA (uracil1498-N3)-methyltransferase
MHRFYSPPGECRGTEIHFHDREAHHLLNVLRIRRGDEVIVLDGAGRELLCSVQTTDRSSVRLAVVKETVAAPLPCELTLLQAVPKGKIFESIIQKATELGAARIVPLLSDRVTLRLDDESHASRREKWQSLAIEAIKQCGSAWLPRVELPVAPAEFLARDEHKPELALIASLQSPSRHPREYFDAFRAKHGRGPASVCVWVGPEGDFTPGEISAIESAGALPITLGRLVLRSETAATYCLSVINYELQSPARRA